MSTRTRYLRVYSGVALLLAAGCSLVNSFDDVAPRSDGTYAAVDAAVRDASADNVVAPDAHADAKDGGIASGGAVVVGGRVDDDAGASTWVLAVLDPANGHEIGQRENMVVAGIQYDGLRDLWYVFESKSNDFVPGVNDEVVLHVRQLDPKTGIWNELSKRTVPTLQSYDSIGVTRERLTYIAYVSPVADANGGLEYVTFDTSNPASLVEMNRLGAGSLTPFGAMSNRSTTGPGGHVNFLRLNSGDCDAGNVCQLELVPVRIPNNGSPVIDPIARLGYIDRFDVPSYGSMPTADLDLVVFPRAVDDAAAPTTARRFDPRDHTEKQTPTPFFVTDSALRRAAVSNCASVAFVVATNGDLQVHAVPIQENGSGTPASAPTGHSGQSVYFEPTSKTVLAPFAQGSGFDFSAFRLEGSPTVPVLTKRVAPGWAPPADLRPVLLGIREPLPATCN